MFTQLLHSRVGELSRRPVPGTSYMGRLAGSDTSEIATHGKTGTNEQLPSQSRLILKLWETDITCQASLPCLCILQSQVFFSLNNCEPFFPCLHLFVLLLLMLLLLSQIQGLTHFKHLFYHLNIQQHPAVTILSIHPSIDLS